MADFLLLPQLDDSIQDFYKETFGTTATGDILTYLRRELMQSVWRILLDDEFMDAYENGIIITFPDGIKRRVFPRFFTYSADYPEKCVGFVFSPNFSYSYLSLQSTSKLCTIPRKLPLPTVPGPQIGSSRVGHEAGF